MPEIGVPAIKEGDLLAGKYRVERVLGVGGMGIVVAAHHIALDTKAAIKFLLPDMLSNREAVARFASEARSAVRIKSEYVARVFDVGTLDTGAPYIVMEFLDGGDLATWLEQRGCLPIDQAVEFMLEVCLAVADAHGLGIVHPGSEAGELLLHSAHRRAALHQGARLRHLEGDRHERHGAGVDDAHLGVDGLAPLHVA
jgi:eukaryotic-like serine/threonine-protein kinase